MANSTNKRSVKPLLETPAFPVTQDTILAYSGNSRQRRKAWRADSARIIAACHAKHIGISANGIGQQVIVKNLFGHVSAVVEVLSDIEY